MSLYRLGLFFSFLDRIYRIYRIRGTVDTILVFVLKRRGTKVNQQTIIDPSSIEVVDELRFMCATSHALRQSFQVLQRSFPLSASLPRRFASSSIRRSSSISASSASRAASLRRILSNASYLSAETATASSWLTDPGL